jgi:ribosomal protein L9
MLWSDRLNLVASPDAVQATNESKKSEESEERGRKEKAETRREKVDDEVISRRPR